MTAENHPDSSGHSGSHSDRHGVWRKKRKKRSFLSRLSQTNSPTRTDLKISLIIVGVLLVLVATGLSDRIWAYLLSLFESSQSE